MKKLMLLGAVLTLITAQAQPNLSPPPHGTYYSLTFSNPPPLPFNPFPSNAVVEVAPDVFIYDDSGVNYQAIQLQQAENTQTPATNIIPAAQSGSAMLALAGGGGESLVGTADHIDNLRRKGGTNTFRMSGLTVGGQYLLLAKPNIAPFLDNPWRALGGFTASAAILTAQVYSPSNLPSEFYMLWRGPYNGPSVVVESPAPGAVITGDITIKLRVTDIAPVSLFVYLNGQPLNTVPYLVSAPLQTEVAAKHSGAPELVIPAGLLRNGANNISVVAINHGVAIVPNTNTLSLTGIDKFATTYDFTITASNEFAIVVNPSMTASTNGAIEFKLESTRAGNVAVDIFNAAGAAVTSITTNVSNSKGAFVTMRWDSASYTDSVYLVRYSFVPGTSVGGTGGAGTTWFTNRIDRNPLLVGSPFITWMELNLTPAERAMDSLCDTVFNDVYTLYQSIIPQYYYTPAEIGVGRTSPDKLKLIEATMATNVYAFHKYMSNIKVETWLYHGHGNQDNLGFNTLGGVAGASISAGSVAKDLGNAIHPVYTGLVDYKRRLRTVIMHGCRTASLNFTTNNPMTPFATEWPNVTGTPTGVDQTVNRIYKTTFIGFEDEVPASPAFIEALMNDWPHLTEQDPNVPIVESMAFALDFAWTWDNGQAYVQAMGPKCLGFPWLPYTTIWDKQLRTNNFGSIHYFPF